MAKPECIDVNVEENVKFGVFANAFRVVEEVGPDCFLDFMVYSATEQRATVVTRVRVRREFLEGIRAKLEDAMVEFARVEFGEEETLDAPAPYRKTKESFH